MDGRYWIHLSRYSRIAVLESWRYRRANRRGSMRSDSSIQLWKRLELLCIHSPPRAQRSNFLFRSCHYPKGEQTICAVLWGPKETLSMIPLMVIHDGLPKSNAVELWCSTMFNFASELNNFFRKCTQQKMRCRSQNWAPYESRKYVRTTKTNRFEVNFVGVSSY